MPRPPIASKERADVAAVGPSAARRLRRNELRGNSQDDGRRPHRGFRAKGSLTPNTVLVLTDAVYFGARWQTPFAKYGTQDGTVTAFDGTTTRARSCASSATAAASVTASPMAVKFTDLPGLLMNERTSANNERPDRRSVDSSHTSYTRQMRCIFVVLGKCDTVTSTGTAAATSDRHRLTKRVAWPLRLISSSARRRRGHTRQLSRCLQNADSCRISHRAAIGIHQRGTSKVLLVGSWLRRGWP
jgi:hypothetical protein